MKRTIRRILKEYNNPNEPFLYSVGDSPIHGQGVFASQDITAGTVIGLLHTILGGGEYDFTELGKLHNHQDEPNCVNKMDDNQRFLVALRDIPQGEELTSDYRLQPDLEQPQEGWLTSESGRSLKMTRKKLKHPHPAKQYNPNRFRPHDRI